MPTVFIPALLRDLTDNQQAITVPGETVRQLIDELEARYPGVKERLFQDDHLHPGISVVVDGEISAQRLRQRLTEKSEVHFLPALSGG